MKITIYTISDCQFSKQEKEYLNTNKLTFEEKNLEANKEFLTEMLAVSNNFAGTPVTKIEKDDGQIVVLKGFTKEEFDKALNLTPAEPIQTPPIEIETQKPVETPKIETPPVAPIEEKPVIPTAPVAPPVAPPITTPDDPLKSILNDLQSKAEPTTPPTAPNPVDVPAVPPVVANAATTPPEDPTIPNFDEK